MEQRKKLQLPPNTAKTLMLMYDTPIRGDGKYGPYALFAFRDPKTQEEFSFFSPSPEVEQALEGFNAGDLISLERIAQQKGSQLVTSYSISSANGGAMKSHLHASPTNGNGHADAVDQDPKTDPMFALLEECYAQAMELAKKYNGIEISKAAITLFISKSKLGGHSFANGIS